MNSLSKKVGMMQGIALSLILLISIVSIVVYMRNTIDHEVKDQFKERVNDVKSIFEVLNESIIESAKSASNVLANKAGKIEIEKDDFITINGVKSNLIKSDGVVLNNNNDFVDDFTKITGAVATIFVKQGDDFYRVATSLKKADGTRAIGTFLTDKSPAFAKVLNKETYIGNAKLFGKNYMTVYEPIVKNGEVIGILFVGYNFDGLYKILESNLRDIKFGNSGYLFMIDKKEELVIMHPVLKDVKIDDIKDERKEVFKDVIGKKEGEQKVTFGDKGEEKLIAYNTFEPWNITIVASQDIKEIMKLSNSVTWFLSIGGIALVIILIIVCFAIIKRTVIVPLEKISTGIEEFFRYLKKENNHIQEIKINGNDEFSRMALVLNENMNIAKINIENEKKLIDEVMSSLSKVEKGDFSQRINVETKDGVLKELKNVINKMVENLEKNTNNVLDVLNSYAEYNYKDKIESNGLTEHLEKLAICTNKVGNIITRMLIESKKNGEILEESSTSLLKNVENINNSSNSAAASLEETAAALEEITSNIRSNTENIAKMSKFSNDITLASKEGEDLANKTTDAMEEINKQVKLVNDAISVIDQISFQTNILSLNATVEAATAGESGKGFAVVAGEVRNLASRSSEAAKEIKAIVEIATRKADEGKAIAGRMIEGYNALNSNIEQTIKVISDVEMASKEQLLGIEQINDAVNQLDRQTQQNANIATQTKDIAVETDNISKRIVEDVRNKKFNEE